MVTGLVPHVGGPILPPGCPTVLIGNLPAARVGDMALCVGPPDVIAMGSATVMIGSMPAARIGDLTAHGGVIVAGFPTVMIGEMGMGGAVSAQAGTMKAAKLAGAAFTKTNCDAAALPPVKANQPSTGGAHGSQAATMSAAKKRAAAFTPTSCDKSRGS
jgi:uncharacterized Zn-binding protein involved in type VI secretion